MFIIIIAYKYRQWQNNSIIYYIDLSIIDNKDYTLAHLLSTLHGLSFEAYFIRLILSYINVF
jgi:hypothetical protein